MSVEPSAPVAVPAVPAAPGVPSLPAARLDGRPSPADAGWGAPSGPASSAGTGAAGGGAGGATAQGPGAGPGAAPGVGPGAGLLPRPDGLPRAPIALPPAVREPWPRRQRSLADMANEQLRRGGPRDRLAEEMERAGREDCLRAPAPGAQTAGGLLAAPVLAARALVGECPR